MFKKSDFSYCYTPLLSMSRSELVALKELPNKDKDLILPLFPLRGWVASKLLKNSTQTIANAIGNRKWIADIDTTFLNEYEKTKEYKLTNEYPREVFNEIKRLIDPTNGYSNWKAYLQEIPEAIPTLQIHDLTQLDKQIDNLCELERGLVVRIPMKSTQPSTLRTLLEVCRRVEDLYVILDYGDIASKELADANNYISLFENIGRILPDKLVSFSATSFPYSFPGAAYGELPIYERLVFNKIKHNCPDVRMVYSDRASSRAERLSGGAGIPPPRIDYPLKHDWRFIRNEFEDSSDVQEGEKNALYIKAAQEMIAQKYWIKGLMLWGTQMIEKTAVADPFGITSAASATAVRINLHLYQQLHYNTDISELDTEEDWID